MTNCISGCASKFRLLSAVRQCLKDSTSEYRKQLYRELGSFTKSQCSILPRINHRFTCQSNDKLWRDHVEIKYNSVFFTRCTYLSSYENKSKVNDNSAKPDKEEKLSLTKRFKRMFKDYWYVLVPVHVVTSAVWFGSFYYLAASGINIPELLQSLGAPESWIENVKDSKAGNAVIAYTLYKIATPFRYTVSLGGTTISINYLKKWGWIKPVPNKEEIKRIYEEQKGALKDFTSAYQDKIQSKKDDLLKRTEEFKEQYTEAKEGLQRSVIDSKRDLKEGVHTLSAELKHVGGLIGKSVKDAFNKKPDYIAKPVKKKNKKQD